MNVFFDWSVPIKNMPLYISAAGVTVLIALITCIAETIIGAWFGYIRFIKRPGILYRIITIYVEIIRNTPLLVQLFFMFYGLPTIGITLSGFTAGLLALIICHSAYTTEIFRAGIQSVNKGQWEAAQCIGLRNSRIFSDVIFPQTLKNIFPALSNQYLMTVLSTSLVSALNVHELTNVISVNAANTFRVFENYTVAILIYYILNIGLSTLLRFINKKYFPSVRSEGE